MFNKILSTVSVMAFATMVLVGGSHVAKATTYITMNPGDLGVLTEGDGTAYQAKNADNLNATGIFTGTLTKALPFSDNFLFTVSDNGSGGSKIKWGADAIFGDPSGVGIGSLTLTWSNGATSGPITDDTSGSITGQAGLDLPPGNWFKTWMTAGLHTLTVSGTVLSQGGGYIATVNAVPLPPAALLFGTALFGIGVLRRRKNKKALELAA